ncbi:MAG: response regulator transcription factor [Bacteroidales bacterium]|nr:response regulator transcription factor [Bacteroidales bacterium]
MKKIHIAIIEDDKELLRGITRTLSNCADIVVEATYSNAEDFIKEVNELKFDIALVDIGLPKMSGIECIKIIKAARPQAQFLMWTTFEDNEKIFEALKVGASGYILKTATITQLIQAITELYQGGSPMSSSIARKVIASFHNPQIKKIEYNLTKRESEILELLAKGYRYKEIGAQLFISFETVRSHIHNIYEKLQVSSRTDALNKIYPRT